MLKFRKKYISYVLYVNFSKKNNSFIVRYLLRVMYLFLVRMKKVNSSVRKLSEGSGTVWYVICEISGRSSSLRELVRNKKGIILLDIRR